MNFQQPDHDGETLIELYGPEDGGWFTTRIHDWIPLCTALRDPDVRGYLILRSLIMEKFHKPVRNLTLGGLCELIPGPNEKSSGLTRVRGILDALSSVGLICTPEGDPIKTSSRPGAAQRVLRIRVNDMPPEGYTGWRNSEAKLKNIGVLAALQGDPEDAGRNSDPAPEGDADTEAAGRNSDPAGHNSDPLSGTDLRKRDHPLVLSFGADGGDAISSRSDGDARRASDGSSVREAEGGVAASSTTSPLDLTKPNTPGAGQGKTAAAGKAKHTREQLDLVRSVRVHYPVDFLKDLPDVPALSDAILGALAGDAPASERTPAQLGARIEQRWNQHGWASKFYAGEIGSLVGAAVAMVRPLKGSDRYGCANPRCEAGVNVDTQQECPTCPERLAARKAERRQQKAQEAAGESSAIGSDVPELPMQRAPRRRECECGNPIIRSGDDVMCGPCRRAADAQPHGELTAVGPPPF